MNRTVLLDMYVLLGGSVKAAHHQLLGGQVFTPLPRD